MTGSRLGWRELRTAAADVLAAKTIRARLDRPVKSVQTVKTATTDKTVREESQVLPVS